MCLKLQPLWRTLLSAYRTMLSTTICDWLLDFLTGRPQTVRIGIRTSASIITNNGTPQGCVLSPILYALFNYYCVNSHKDNTILKFADDTTVIGCITGGDGVAYRRETASPTVHVGAISSEGEQLQVPGCPHQ